MNYVRFCLIILIGLFSSAESSAQVTLPEGVSVYAGGTLDFTSFCTVTGGSVLAGGNVSHTGGSLFVDEMSGGGGFSAEGAAFQDSFGPLFFNGDISGLGGPGSVLDGPVTSAQGNIVFLTPASTVINGDVTAAGDVTFDFVFGTINGNVFAGGTTNITATVVGFISPLTTSITPFTLQLLPSGRGLTAGTTDIILDTFEDVAIAPGTYGTLTFASGNSVTLTAGRYIFEDIVSDFSLNVLNFDTTSGNIDLYVAADNFAFDELIQAIDGDSLFVGSDIPDPQLSNNIFMEAAGNLTIGTEFYGTAFAPNGDVTIENFSTITGRVFAGGNVTVENLDITTVGESDVVIVPTTDLLGDLNQDGDVNFLDLAPFIAALASNTYSAEADCNQDGVLNFLDIASFIAILTGR